MEEKELIKIALHFETESQVCTFLSFLGFEEGFTLHFILWPVYLWQHVLGIKHEDLQIHQANR